MSAEFGPRWLDRRLAAVIESHPRIALCVAFSGGPDSLALLAALVELRDEVHPKLGLRALHVDHGLQRESAAWATQCAALCRALRVPLQVLTANLAPARGESAEAQAREARYRLLAANLAKDEVLLTAQHLDDQAETVLLQLLRGAGVAGLAAMSPSRALGRGQLIRPLLDRPRADLAGYLSKRGLPAIDDPMNTDPRWARARLRLELMPVLEEHWPGAVEALARSARHAAEAQGLLAELAAQDLALARDGETLLVAVVRRWSLARRRNALRLWIGEVGATPPDTTRLTEIAVALLDARPDAHPRVEWPAASVRREAGRLWITRKQAVASGTFAPVSWNWRRRGRATLEGEFGSLKIVRDASGPVDLDRLPEVLEIRARGGGEKLRPRPGGPRRTVKALLQEGRVSAASRAAIPLIFAGEQLVAIGERWIDASILAGEDTRRRGRIVWRGAAGSPAQ